MGNIIKIVTDPLFLILLAFIIILGFFNLIQRTRRHLAWQRIAKQYDMQISQHKSALFGSNSRFLSGTYRGRKLTVTESMGRRATERQRQTTRNEINTGITLVIPDMDERRLKFGDVIRLGGDVPVITGDKGIDKRLDVESEPEWLGQSVLTSGSVFEKLPQFRNGSVIAAGKELFFRSNTSMIAQEERLQFLFDFLSDVADAIERYR